MAWRWIVCLLGLGLLVAPRLPFEPRVVSLEPAQFKPEQGHAYTVDLGALRVWAPSDEGGTSELVLFENGIALAKPHQQHAVIRSEGRGRYSHWGQGLYISTSDNSDPRTNGRSYTIEVPGGLRPRLSKSATLLGGVCFLVPLLPITFLSPQRRGQWLRGRTLPLLVAVGVLGAAVACFLWNGIDVTTPFGHWFYIVFAVGLFVVGFGYQFTAWRAEKRYGFKSELPAPMRWTSGLINIAVGLLYVAAATESAARAFPVVTSLAIDPGVVHLWPEWFEPRNTLGYNDREPAAKRGPRVLVLGDSFTEGAGVRRHERYSAVLEAALRRHDPTIDVLNAGRCGYDTVDEADVLEKTGDAVQPDVVVVGYVLNDAEGADPPSKAALRPMTRFLLQRCRSYAYYRLYITNHMSCITDPTETHPGVDEIIERQHAPDGPGWQRVLSGMDRIADWCDRRGVRRILVVYPYLFGSPTNSKAVMDRVVAAAQARGFEARSALDDFGGRWDAFALSVHDPHPSVDGHRVMGHKLYEMMGMPKLSYRAPAPVY